MNKLIMGVILLTTSLTLPVLAERQIMGYDQTTNGDFTMTSLRPLSDGGVERRVMVFRDQQVTNEIHPTGSLQWDDVLQRTTEEQIILLDLDGDSPSICTPQSTTTIPITTTRDQLFGILTQSKTLMVTNEDISKIFRSLAVLFDNTEEVGVEIDNLRAILKASNTELKTN